MYGKRRLGVVNAASPVERLVGLLKGDGLTRDTVEELRSPQSALLLRAVLTDRVFAPEASLPSDNYTSPKGAKSDPPESPLAARRRPDAPRRRVRTSRPALERRA